MKISVKSWQNQEAFLGPKPSKRKLSSLFRDIWVSQCPKAGWECRHRSALPSGSPQVLNHREHQGSSSRIQLLASSAHLLPCAQSPSPPAAPTAQHPPVPNTSLALPTLPVLPVWVSAAATTFPNRKGHPEPQSNTFSASCTWVSGCQRETLFLLKSLY